MKIGIRRVYDPPEKDEGLRVLVDRIWPRGMRKEDLPYDVWDKNIAPTPELRKWFGHDPERWKEFHEKYRRELAAPEVQERLKNIRQEAGKRPITLLYAARDIEHNHALILAEAFKKL